MKRISVVLMAMVIVLCCLVSCGEQGGTASSGAAATSSSGAGSTTAANGDELTTTTDAIGTTDASSTDAIGTDGATGVSTTAATTTGTGAASKTSTTKKPVTTTIGKPATTTTKKLTTTTTTTVNADWLELEEKKKNPDKFIAEVEQLVVQKLNEYRISEGTAPATALLGLTEVARYRAKQLITNFAHDTGDEREAFAYFQYGKYIDATLFGSPAENSYYSANVGEAIGKGGWSWDAEELSQKIADGFFESKGHWRYVGSSENPYIAVGIKLDASGWRDTWYCCIFVTDTNQYE